MPNSNIVPNGNFESFNIVPNGNIGPNGNFESYDTVATQTNTFPTQNDTIQTNTFPAQNDTIQTNIYRNCCCSLSYFIFHISTKTAVNPEPTAVHTETELPHLLFLQPSFCSVCIKFRSVFCFAPFKLIVNCCYILPIRIFTRSTYVLLFSRNLLLWSLRKRTYKFASEDDSLETLPPEIFPIYIYFWKHYVVSPMNFSFHGSSSLQSVFPPFFLFPIFTQCVYLNHCPLFHSKYFAYFWLPIILRYYDIPSRRNF